MNLLLFLIISQQNILHQSHVDSLNLDECIERCEILERNNVSSINNDDEIFIRCIINCI